MFNKSYYSPITIRLHGAFSYLFLVVANSNFDNSSYQPGFPAVKKKPYFPTVFDNVGLPSHRLIPLKTVEHVEI